MSKNHKTTTLLVAMAAVAATLLAAGTVAALGSNHFAFAHKEYKKWYGEDNKYGNDQGRGDYGRDQKRDGDQYLKCIVIGGGGGDEIKRSDGGTIRADPTISPGLDRNGGGISDHSCNNYDSGTFTPSTGDGVIPRG
jgi:hypothetical protein